MAIFLCRCRLPLDIGDQKVPVANIVVYNKHCRKIGGTLTLDDLAETSEISDWLMPDFRMACSYAAKQGWLIVEDDVLTLTAAGAGGGPTIGRWSIHSIGTLESPRRAMSGGQSKVASNPAPHRRGSTAATGAAGERDRHRPPVTSFSKWTRKGTGHRKVAGFRQI